ncbi:polysaccharide pyruvyl transferase family protein [Novosphingobium guangzhouense]|uniref:Polysaccharide pyruvyl transferase domain-containing protein n=1 Tax=Novosphingobium guangzhouense TaxID=1850347 RepID=A0A2K2FZ50_9SPHN|nr:polysaccharide pyruvyl transferase family protein [Novosphingobium guangzhouense]PNU04067.1 hypothetical protein A8V01_05540 [Novosphingobium guangzhouense]
MSTKSIADGAADAPPSILLCGETFSNNLGDGVIAHCVEYLVKQVIPAARVNHLDLAGRTRIPDAGTVGAPGARKRSVRSPYLRMAKVLARWSLRSRKALQQKYHAAFSGGTDLVILNGGHLFIDNDLNFPLKLRLLCSIASKKSVPVVANACGCSSNWSRLGRSVIRDALNNPWFKRASFRDVESAQKFRALGPRQDLGVAVTADPAFWSADAFGVTRPAARANRIGICITHPGALQKHSAASDRFEDADVFDFFVNTIERLAADGKHLVLFTNGDPPDERFLDSVVSSPRLAQFGDFLKRERCGSPDALVRLIAGFDVVIAHRLHANIIAFSLGVPSIGLIWDAKVRDFAKLSGRANMYIEPGDQRSVGPVLDRLKHALTEEVDLSALARLKELALRDIEAAVSPFASVRDSHVQ